MFANYYLSRFARYERFIESKPNAEIGISVAIPAYNEPNIIPSLESLLACERPEKPVEVIVTINDSVVSPEAIKQQNRKTYSEVNAWIDKNQRDWISFYTILVQDFPKKSAGAGLARKTGMDEAIRRFNDVENPNGIITGFDADSLCVN